MNFEIEKNSPFKNDVNLLLGSAAKSNCWQYFNCVIKGHLIN